MLSSALVFGKFFNGIIISFLLTLWNPSFVETYDADGVNYNLEHIKLDEGESIWAWEVELKTICEDQLFADILNQNPRSSYVELTDDQLDKLLYSVLISLNYYYKNVRYAWDDLSLKNFPEVLKLHFEAPSHLPPFIQLLDGQNLYIGACRDQAALKAPMKGTWIISKKKVTYPPYSQIQSIKPKMTTPVPIHSNDCSDDLFLTNQITVESLNVLLKESWSTMVYHYWMDRNSCVGTPTTKKKTCLCTLNKTLKSQMASLMKKK